MVARATFYDVVYTDAYVINESDDPAPRVKFANCLMNSLTTGTLAHRDSGSPTAIGSSATLDQPDAAGAWLGLIDRKSGV